VGSADCRLAWTAGFRLQYHFISIAFFGHSNAQMPQPLQYSSIIFGLSSAVMHISGQNFQHIMQDMHFE
jgi:hypothetical protein